jgi:TIR domain-containing protein
VRIYISCSEEDLPVARALVDGLGRHFSPAAAAGHTIYNPLDDPELAGKDEGAVMAARRAKLAESNFIVLLLSPSALRSPLVVRDLEHMREIRTSYPNKFYLTVLLQPVTLDDDLAKLRSIDATSRSLDEVAAEIVYYTTWRLLQSGGSIRFVPPSAAPAPPAAPPASPLDVPPAAPPLPPDPGWVSRGAPGGAPPAPASAPPPAPRAEPGAPPTTPAAPRSTGTLQFSAYHPNTVAVETWHTLLIYTYVAEALGQIQADATTFTELGSAPTVAQGQSARAVARGVELTIEPHMEGVTFSPASDAFVWREDWHRSLFRFSGAGTLAGREQRGWIDIYAGPMVPIARIDVTFPFHDARPQHSAASAPRGLIVTSNIYDAVFISYSHRDGEAFRQACEEYRRFGITTYTDEQLEAGAQYERELSNMIAEAKIFHLLWSPNSAGSFECRKEWLSALRREPSERFIKPWYWKKPLAPLPDEFVQHRISFKYEPLKRSLWKPQTWF